MVRPLRYWVLAVVSVVSLHYLATYLSTGYRQHVHNWSTAALSATSSARGGSTDLVSSLPSANATFFVLCRESELNDILGSIQLLESTFNDKPRNHYPYVFLNNEHFSEHFKQRIRTAVSSTVEFGLVPPEMWDIPPHIDLNKAQNAWREAERKGVPYGASQSYRQMCRFQSGFFFRHPLLEKYKYYWRVEPGTKLSCDLEDFDPFRFMHQNQKKYGWVISLHEIPGTIPTLWVSVREWLRQNPHHFAQNNLWQFITSNNGRSYSNCHFWSNFEIADMDFYRSEGYLSFFNHLDQAGGFFYQRWGDAPVHTIGAALMLDKSDFHHFDNIGYSHVPFVHCPKLPKHQVLAKNGRAKCFCAHEISIDFDDGHFSCLHDYLDLYGKNSTQARIDHQNVDF